MLHKDMHKHEIEEALNDKGEFIQIHHLTKLLEEELPVDIKKYIILRLATLYESRKMFNDCAKMHENAEKYSIAFSEKRKYMVKAAELYIEAGNFENADYSMKKAMNNANDIEKQDIAFTVKKFYMDKAEEFEKSLKRAHAVKIYEKLLEMNINEAERIEIKEKLLGLYEKLGRMQEYYKLKRMIE